MSNEWENPETYEKIGTAATGILSALTKLKAAWRRTPKKDTPEFGELVEAMSGIMGIMDQKQKHDHSNTHKQLGINDKLIHIVAELDHRLKNVEAQLKKTPIPVKRKSRKK